MFISVIFPNNRQPTLINRQYYFELELKLFDKNKCLWPVKNTNINFAYAKNSKKHKMRIHMVIIVSHHAPAALLRAEKNIIKLGNIYIYIIMNK